jgi:hypothetical protein
MHQILPALQSAAKGETKTLSASFRVAQKVQTANSPVEDASSRQILAEK